MDIVTMVEKHNDINTSKFRQMRYIQPPKPTTPMYTNQHQNHHQNTPIITKTITNIHQSSPKPLPMYIYHSSQKQKYIMMLQQEAFNIFPTFLSCAVSRLKHKFKKPRDGDNWKRPDWKKGRTEKRPACSPRTSDPETIIVRDDVRVRAWPTLAP